MRARLTRLGSALGRVVGRPAPVAMRVGPDGPCGEIVAPRGGDGVWETVAVEGRHCLTPDPASHYIYFGLPAEFRLRAGARAWVEIEYRGERYGRFRLQYASTDRAAPGSGLYKGATQLWTGEAPGLDRFRRALFPLPDFDGRRTQNQGASFRVEFREDLRIAAVRVFASEPPGLETFREVAPTPELKKLPGRLYPINYLFLEITNACNFKCTWCPDAIMSRRRGFMGRQQAFSLLEELAAKRSTLGPLYPVKLHQMGEPLLHPDLVAIVGHAEKLGLGVELNTNCGLITTSLVDRLYEVGLTNLILSYQTPDAGSFRTRRAPRLGFGEYRAKVRLAVERKLALAARTRIEIDILNTKHAAATEVVSRDDQARAFVEEWIEFCRGLEREFRLAPRLHELEQLGTRRFLDQDENGSRYTLIEGVDLIWKRCHSWGNLLGFRLASDGAETYCAAPYEQLVIQWNGDVATCCIDHEGRTKVANAFHQSIESVWTGEILKRRKRDMLEGRLLDVCARCLGVKLTER